MRPAASLAAAKQVSLTTLPMQAIPHGPRYALLLLRDVLCFCRLALPGEIARLEPLRELSVVFLLGVPLAILEREACSIPFSS